MLYGMEKQTVKFLVRDLPVPICSSAEMPEIEAQDSDCLVEYDPALGFTYCGPRIFPSLCHVRCVLDKGAKTGRCEWDEESETLDVKCLCDFCSREAKHQILSEMPEIDAQDSDCLIEYGAGVGFAFCGPIMEPSLCYVRCALDKGAKGGKCEWGEGINVKCLCDFCSDEPDQILSGI
ncbi:hypothetical protein Bca52824_029322 [Brassica carinata]|uniref:Knottins-like domain-containing protein n=1 Tax=Brassica carinata TaxID=52824 RepID=A0A8X7VEB2_BRACI|nr:hypothetical protein Bca52824_029322 [Brassica carinata]